MRSQAKPEGRKRMLALCGGIAVMLAVPQPKALGQVTSAPAQVALGSLHIEILEGEGALNNIRQRDAREPAVQVTDENHKPVAGAAVLFLIHSGPNGAGATFESQSLSFTVTTGPDGIARPSQLTLGKSPGSFTISVTATLGTLVATTVIHESNILGALNSSSNASTSGNVASSGTVARHSVLGMSKTVAIAVGSVVVAGVVIGVVEATKSSGGTSLTLGTGTIGP